jgi:hypothetical protein
MTSADFNGVTLDDLVVLEQVFNLNVYREIKPVQTALQLH